MKRTRLILYPDSHLRSFVDAMSFFLMIMISIYMPLVISFDVDTSGTFDIFELFIDCWFTLEVVLNFFTAFYEKGILIVDLHKIFWNYLKSWLMIDLSSSVPVLVMFIISREKANDFQAMRSAKLLRVVRFARYARLIRLVKFLRMNKYL